MTTTRIPPLEIGSLQSRLPDLIAKKGSLARRVAPLRPPRLQAALTAGP